MKTPVPGVTDQGGSNFHTFRRYGSAKQTACYDNRSPPTERIAYRLLQGLAIMVDMTNGLGDVEGRSFTVEGCAIRDGPALC